MNINKQLLKYYILNDSVENNIKIKFIIDNSIHNFENINKIIHPDLNNFPIINNHLSKTKLDAFNRIGLIFENTKINMFYEVIGYFNSRNTWVKFEDNTIIKNNLYKHVKNGNIGNPNKKYEYKSFIKNKKAYKCYHNIKNRLLNNKSYNNVSLSKEWENYEIFENWFILNYIDGFEIDKDLNNIKNGGPKIYSAETCCFLPNYINNLLQNNRNGALIDKGICKQNNSNNYTVKLQGENYGTYSDIELAKEKYINIKLELLNNYVNESKNLLPNEIYNLLKSITFKEFKKFIYGEENK